MTFELWDNFWRKLVKTWDFKTSKERPFQNIKFLKKNKIRGNKYSTCFVPCKKVFDTNMKQIKVIFISHLENVF